MYLARHHTKDSYPDLARAFGGKHHTTVISAVQKIIERVKDDASLRSEIHAIEVADPAMTAPVTYPVRTGCGRSGGRASVGVSVVHTLHCHGIHRPAIRRR